MAKRSVVQTVKLLVVRTARLVNFPDWLCDSTPELSEPVLTISLTSEQLLILHALGNIMNSYDSVFLDTCLAARGGPRRLMLARLVVRAPK